MVTELERVQRELNSEARAPRRGYRRDVAVYELVCYVNNITGCYLSKNLKPIRVFIARARDYMMHNARDEEDRDYFAQVQNYLNLMEEYLAQCPT